MSTLNKNQQSKKRARIYFAIIMTGVVLIIMAFIFAANKKPKQKKAVEDSSTITTSMTGFKVAGGNDDTWYRNKIEQTTDQNSQSIASLKQSLKGQFGGNDGSIALIKAQNEELAMRLAKLEKQQVHHVLPQEEIKQPLQVQRLSFEPTKTEPLKTIDNSLIGGTIFKARIEHGLDADTGETSTQSKVPILMKILNHGDLPRNYQANFKHCTCEGVATGNINSSRVDVRLLRLNCVTRDTGELVSTNVNGYVTQKGMAGIKGELIDHTAEKIAKSGLASFLGGLAGFVGSRDSNGNALRIVTDETKSSSLMDKLSQATSDGANSGLESIASAQLEEVRKYRPIVRINGGVDVTVIVKGEPVLIGNSLSGQMKSQQNDKKRRRLTKTQQAQLSAFNGA